MTLSLFFSIINWSQNQLPECYSGRAEIWAGIYSLYKVPVCRSESCTFCIFYRFLWEPFLCSVLLLSFFSGLVLCKYTELFSHISSAKKLWFLIGIISTVCFRWSSPYIFLNPNTAKETYLLMIDLCILYHYKIAYTTMQKEGRWLGGNW